MKSQKTCSSPKAPLTLKSLFQHERGQQPFSFPPATDEHFSISLTQFRMGKKSQPYQMRNSLFKGHEPRGFTRIFLPVHKHPTFLFLPAVLELRYYIYHHFFLLLRNYTSFFFFSFAFRAQNPFSMYRCLMSYHNKEAISSPFQRLSAHQMLEPGITRATKVITS